MISGWLHRHQPLNVAERRFWGIFCALVVVQEVPTNIVRVPMLAGIMVALLEFCPRPEAKAVLQVLYKPLEWIR